GEENIFGFRNGASSVANAASRMKSRRIPTNERCHDTPATTQGPPPLEIRCVDRKGSRRALLFGPSLPGFLSDLRSRATGEGGAGITSGLQIRPLCHIQNGRL